MNKTRTVLTGVAALAATAAIGACSNSATKEAAPSASSSVPSASSGTSSSVAPASAHNQADMQFAHMMIPHHQQAIEMSDIILGKQGIDPRVVDLATQIKAAQGPEIEKMQVWMDQWGMGGMSDMPGMSGMPGMDHGGMHGSDSSAAAPTTSMMPSGSMMRSGSMMPGMGMSGMDGMMSPAEMDALKNADGVQASKLFLTGMIKHHQGAITMSQDEINNGESADAIALAKSIIESQQKEIDTMNQILGSL